MECYVMTTVVISSRYAYETRHNPYAHAYAPATRVRVSYVGSCQCSARVRSYMSALRAVARAMSWMSSPAPNRSVTADRGPAGAAWCSIALVPFSTDAHTAPDLAVPRALSACAPCWACAASTWRPWPWRWAGTAADAVASLLVGVHAAAVPGGARCGGGGGGIPGE